MLTSAVFSLLGLAGFAVLMHRVGVWATLRFTREQRAQAASLPEPDALPPLTLLKPLKGLEEGLEGNLVSFYEQAYPASLQVVFASAETADPALVIARRIAERYPTVETDFVISRESFGSNPKVCNLHGALEAARYDLLLQSDANVRIAPGYLKRIVSEFVATDASFLGSLVVGDGERSAGALLENLQLTAFITPGICTARALAGVTCILGKAMLLRRSELQSLGGLASVKDVLAEDFVLAQRYQAAGKKVVLSASSVANVNVDTPIPRFLARHSRWLKMRAVLSSPGMVADFLSNPLPFALAAWVVAGFDPRLLAVTGGVCVYKALSDERMLVHLRGHGMGLHVLWAAPLRDLLAAGLWCYACVSRTTEWRGRRFRLSRGSQLTPLPESPDSTGRKLRAQRAPGP